jgi:enoyl-CoA hydratase/carnithine racemase
MTTQPLPVKIDQDGPFQGVATVLLEQPGKPVVVLELELIQRLEAALKSIPSTVVGVVLASASERVFVAGADLKAIMAMNDAELDKYLVYGSKVFGMISQLPCPTVAAINGAALGGGLEVAMHCDGLVAAPPPSRDGQPGRPYPVGLPEAGLSICPGWGGTNLLPARMDPAEAMRRTASGTPLTFDDANAAGLFDAVASSSDKLLDTAKAWVKARSSHGRASRDGAPLRWIGRHPRSQAGQDALEGVRDQIAATQSGKAVAEAVEAGLSKGWQAALAVERRELIRLRHTPAAKEAINAFFAKAAAPKK